MGHMDGRMTEDDVATPKPQAGVKDGTEAIPSEQAPAKDDASQASAKKAPDVLHGGHADSKIEKGG